MANTKVTALTEITALAEDDMLLVSDVSAGESKKISAESLREHALPWERRERLAFHEDFLALFAGTMFAEVVSGAGASHVALGLGTHPGIPQGTTGTTAVGVAGVTSPIPHVYGAGPVEFSWLGALVTLATVGEDYDFQVGHVVDDQVLDSQGIFFSYRRGLRGANWHACCHDGVTLNAVDTGVPVAAGIWTRLAFVVDAGGASVSFYVDDVLRATLNANVPGFNDRISWWIGKTAGTTARKYMVDSVSERIGLTVAR